MDFMNYVIDTIWLKIYIFKKAKVQKVLQKRNELVADDNLAVMSNCVNFREFICLIKSEHLLFRCRLKQVT